MDRLSLFFYVQFISSFKLFKFDRTLFNACFFSTRKGFFILSLNDCITPYKLRSIMIFISDGSSEHHAQVLSALGNLICYRHLVIQTAMSFSCLLLSPQRPYPPPAIRAQWSSELFFLCQIVFYHLDLYPLQWSDNQRRHFLRLPFFFFFFFFFFLLMEFN